MMAASQNAIDDAARAIAQERLDCSLTWRQIAAKVHGFPEPQRNLVNTVRATEMPPTREGGAYYDRIIEAAPAPVIAPTRAPQAIPVQTSSQPASVQPAPALPVVASGLSTAVKSAVAAGGILGAGALGYLWPKGGQPVVTPPAVQIEQPVVKQPAAETTGNLLHALRQRGYHLPPGGAIKK